MSEVAVRRNLVTDATCFLRHAETACDLTSVVDEGGFKKFGAWSFRLGCYLVHLEQNLTLISPFLITVILLSILEVFSLSGASHPWCGQPIVDCDAARCPLVK